jgi:hypothetical protein
MGRTYILALFASIASVQKRAVAPHGWSNTWPDVEAMWSTIEGLTFFHYVLDRTADKKKTKQMESLLKEYIAAEWNICGP